MDYILEDCHACSYTSMVDAGSILLRIQLERLFFAAYLYYQPGNENTAAGTADHSQSGSRSRINILNDNSDNSPVYNHAGKGYGDNGSFWDKRLGEAENEKDCDTFGDSIFNLKYQCGLCKEI